MDKKKILLIALACCLLLVVGIIWVTSSENLTGIPDLKGEMTWVKCSNPDCGISYEMPLRDYYQLVDKKQKEAGGMNIVCKKCGKESLFKAVKCEKCQVVFFYVFGSVEDYADRCPECGFSKLEDASKKRPTQ